MKDGPGRRGVLFNIRAFSRARAGGSRCWRNLSPSAYSACSLARVDSLAGMSLSKNSVSLLRLCKVAKLVELYHREMRDSAETAPELKCDPATFRRSLVP